MKQFVFQQIPECQVLAIVLKIVPTYQGIFRVKLKAHLLVLSLSDGAENAETVESKVGSIHPRIPSGNEIAAI